MLGGKIRGKKEKTSRGTTAHNELQTGNRRSRATDFNPYKEREVEMTPVQQDKTYKKQTQTQGLGTVVEAFC